MQEWFEISLYALKISIVLQVFAIGLGTSWYEVTYFFRQPRLLWNSILARNIAVPILALVLILAFNLSPPVRLTIAVLAVTPVPPLIPRAQLKEGGRPEYTLGLLVSQSFLAILFVPLTVLFMAWVIGANARIGVGPVLRLVLLTILLPLFAGLLVAHFLPRARDFTIRLMRVGTVLLFLGAIPLLLLGWRAFGVLAGTGGLLALSILVVVSTLVGDLLGGPVREDRVTLALATSARHPAIALAIAAANYPAERAVVAGAVVIYMILREILSVPYTTWRKSAPRPRLSG